MEPKYLFFILSEPILMRYPITKVGIMNTRLIMVNGTSIHRKFKIGGTIFKIPSLRET